MARLDEASKEARLASRALTGTARQLHLARAARTAGEAFAFVETEAPARRARGGHSSALMWATIAVIALAALLFGF
jgi:hypothetical protein